MEDKIIEIGIIATSFLISYYLASCGIKKWMQISGVENFDNTIGVLVYSISPNYALIIYDNQTALWHNSILYIYDSVLVNQLNLYLHEEYVLTLDTREKWYGPYSIASEVQIYNFIYQMKNVIEKHILWIERESKFNILDIINELLNVEILKK
ncbi:hypothetical protein PV326_003168 [Microctonus aethiopoides]|nr:hypothetical protein PV326_003168 [Microctonus aethiopoides]